jgi:alpha-amylase
VYHDLANVFMLAWPYGHPSVMSSFAFDRATPAGRDSGPSSDASGHTLPVYSNGAPRCAASPGAAQPGAWVCEHRTRSVYNMVAFRRVAGASAVVHAWNDGTNQIAFGRGDRGFVVINREAAPLVKAFPTDLAKGTYCDIVGGDFAAGACSGATIDVDAAGVASINVPPNSAVAIHVEAKL